jgi:hypothetical protein
MLDVTRVLPNLSLYPLSHSHCLAWQPSRSNSLQRKPRFLRQLYVTTSKLLMRRLVSGCKAAGKGNTV